MTPTSLRLAGLAIAGLAFATSVLAESLASSASSAGSAASGSVSDSLKGSSNSSSGTRQVADGDYRVLEVAAVAQRPGRVQLRLQAAQDPQHEFQLELPQATAAAAGLAVGDLVRSRQRPYGLEFARADTQQAFFLVLEDDWSRELPSRPVSL